MGITMKDVAKKAGVASSTVSRVISGKSKISDETRKKVLEVMEELDYHPNTAARNLANQKTFTIGLVLPSLDKNLMHNPFFVKALNGISKSAKNKGYFILYGNATDADDELKMVKRLVNSKAVDGIILTTVLENDKTISFLRKKKFPYVTIGRQNHKNSYWVDNDNVKAMYKVVKYLLEKRISSVAFIGGEHVLKVTQYRLKGYKRALLENNIKIDEKLIKEVEFSELSGYEATKEISDYKLPDAIVTTDDILAFGALKYLKEIGKQKEISIVGFNNTPLAEYKNPSLTSVDISAETLGYQASDLLIKVINKSIDRKNILVTTKLIKRDTTKFQFEK